MSSRHIIQDWVDSLVRPDLLRPDGYREDSEPPAECLHLDEALIQHDSPSNTPLTSTNRSAPRDVTIRRHGDQLDGSKEEVLDPNTNFNTPSPPQPRHSESRSVSPTKHAKTGVESRDNLTRLEKPVFVFGLGPETANLISEDVRDLYKDVRTVAQFKQRIVPHEVRDEILALDKDVPEHVFREPDGEIVLSSSNAMSTHVTLLRLVRATIKSEQYKRPEAAWNNHVHSPLLELVFGSDPWDPHGPDADQPVVVRFEAVMGATIVGTAIPFMKPSQLDYRPHLACSVSLDNSAKETNESNSGTIDPGRMNLTELHSRSESKKVDYVVVMYLNENEKLRQIIWDGTFEEGLGHGYVNQTVQLNLLYNPIAVSIETKISSSQSDPLVQLGLWTAAWHKRMYELRHRLFPSPPRSYLPAGSTPTHRRLVSVPLIEVISHEWFVYFACDSGSSIGVYGPLRLGSTMTVLEIYSLVASLECVRRWVETAFREGVEAWFMRAGA